MESFVFVEVEVCHFEAFVWPMERLVCLVIMFLFWGRAGVFTSLQAKDIGHGVEKGDRSGCFCHDVFGLGT